MRPRVRCEGACLAVPYVDSSCLPSVSIHQTKQSCVELLTPNGERILAGLIGGMRLSLGGLAQWI